MTATTGFSNTRFPCRPPTGMSAPTSGTGADFEQLTYLTAGGLSTPLVTSFRRRSEATIAFTYDALGRLTLKDVPRGGRRRRFRLRPSRPPGLGPLQRDRARHHQRHDALGAAGFDDRHSRGRQPHL